MLFEASSAELIADWIETCLLVSSSGYLGRDRLEELARDEIGATPSSVANGLSVMSRRSSVLGVEYPFAVLDYAVRRREALHADPYSALLFLTPGSIARQSVRAAETSEMAELFEEISALALANLWGKGGSAMRFAFPSRHGRPEHFDQAIEWLAGVIGVDCGRGYRPPYRKDGGVDVVAWRHFADRRAGFPIALAQCTIQGETFTKTSDIDLRLWASWLALDVDPLSLLVLPGTIRTAGTEWGQLSSVVMLIDRMRLIELLARDDVSSIASGWVRHTVDALSELLGVGEL